MSFIGLNVIYLYTVDDIIRYFFLFAYHEYLRLWGVVGNFTRLLEGFKKNLSESNPIFKVK